MSIGLAINSGNVGGGGGNSTGIPTGGGNAPGNVSGITVTGTLDPIAREIFLTVTFTVPTDPGDTWKGVHVYLDIPDHGDGTSTAKVGTAIVGTSVVLGPFNPIDLGLQTNPQQPWYFSFPFPGSLGLNPNVDTPCRLYLASTSVISANQLIQDGQPNATPNAAFTLVSTASGSPTAGTNITANCGTITCQALLTDTSTGKSMSPFVALMGSVPSNPPKGWGYRLYLYTGTGQPANVAGMVPLTDVCTTAGIVPSGKADLVTDVLNSFAVQTPGTATQATVYAVAGLVDTGGNFNANNIVPGITNSCVIPLGSTSGTIDAAQAIQSSIEAELTTATGKLGISPAMLTSAFLAPGAAVGNLANSSIIAPLLAAGVAQTNLGIVSAAAIITPATITGLLIANTTITGSLLATSGIITSSAQIGTAVVGAANIGSCNVSVLQAGTATFSSTVVFQSSSGPAVTITSTQVALTGGSYTIGLNSSSGITISSSGASLAITSSAISITNGSYSATVSASSIVLAFGGAYPQLALLSSALFVSHSATDYLEVASNLIQMVAGGFTPFAASSAGVSMPEGATVGAILTLSTGQISCGSSQGELVLNTNVSSSATGGSASSLPSTPAGYMFISTSGSLFKVPLYNV